MMALGAGCFWALAFVTGIIAAGDGNAWLMLGMLAAMAALTAVILIALDWHDAKQVMKDARRDVAPPPADLAFLANCLWCADLSEEAGDCSCTEGCTEVEWCVARYEHTNTSIGTIPVYREDGRG